MKVQTLRPAPAKPYAAQAKAVVNPTKPASAQTKTPTPAAQPSATVARQVIAGEERRRSQRVLLRVRAKVHVSLKGEQVTMDVDTVSVNSHGALLVMKQGLPLEARVVLEHSTTKQRVGCKVVRSPREMPEGYHVPLEFDSPEPNFWGIAFPPADWRPPEDL